MYLTNYKILVWKLSSFLLTVHHTLANACMTLNTFMPIVIFFRISSGLINLYFLFLLTEESQFVFIQLPDTLPGEPLTTPPVEKIKQDKSEKNDNKSAEVSLYILSYCTGNKALTIFFLRHNRNVILDFCLLRNCYLNEYYIPTTVQNRSPVYWVELTSWRFY